MVLFLRKRYKLLLVMLLVLSMVILLLKHNGIIGGSPRIPEILFMCEKYDSHDELCEVSFIDKYGQCYFSNNKRVCKELRQYCDFTQDLVYEYRAGRIKLCASLERSEVMKKYRKMYQIAEKGDIIGSSIHSGILFSVIENHSPERWYWEWLYYDFAGRIQSVTIHEKQGGVDDYVTTNNKQINQIYEWCRDTMDEVDMGYGYQ